MLPLHRQLLFCAIDQFPHLLRQLSVTLAGLMRRNLKRNGAEVLIVTVGIALQKRKDLASSSHLVPLQK